MINLGDTKTVEQQGSDVITHLMSAVHMLVGQVEAIKKERELLQDEISDIRKQQNLQSKAYADGFKDLINVLDKQNSKRDGSIDRLLKSDIGSSEALSIIQGHVDRLTEDLNGCKEQFTRTGTATEEFNVVCNLSIDGMSFRQLIFRNGQLAFVSAESRPKKSI